MIYLHWNSFPASLVAAARIRWFLSKSNSWNFYLSKPVRNVSIKSSEANGYPEGKGERGSGCLVLSNSVVLKDRGKEPETGAAPSTMSVQRCYMKHRPSLSMSAQSRPSPNTTSPPLKAQTLAPSPRDAFYMLCICFFRLFSFF